MKPPFIHLFSDQTLHTSSAFYVIWVQLYKKVQKKQQLSHTKHASVFKSSSFARLVNKILQKVIFHATKGVRLRNHGHMIYAKSEAELFQILKIDCSFRHNAKYIVHAKSFALFILYTVCTNNPKYNLLVQSQMASYVLYIF